MSDSRWYFTEEQLENSASRKCGISAELELSYRQRAANLIQEMGQRLQVSQLCINTAIVYMHRFYAFHAFTMFHRNTIAAAAFFLAAKVEEQPRKLEHVIKILNICLEKTDTSRDMYAEQAQELVLNENILLQTLGFDVAIDHPHTHVVKACQLFNIVTVSRELRQTCYFMASNSLHLTTMCLKYRPTVVAAFCIYIACKWSRWEIPDSSEGKAWYSYVDDSVTLDTLKKLTDEYLQILERSPSKFKSKMKAITTSNGQASLANALAESSSTHHKNPNHNDKQHHHHHHHRTNSTSSSSAVPSATATTLSSTSSNGSSRKQYPPGDQKAPMHQSSSAGYKQNVPQQQQQQPSTGSSSTSTAQSQQHQMHRQRPGPQASSQQQQQQQAPYSSSANKSTDERQRHQDPYFNQSQSSQQRMPDKHRMSGVPATGSSSATQGFLKTGSEQKHSVIPNSSSNTKMQPAPYAMDIGKNMKQNHNDYHNPRSNPMAQMIQQQAILQKKQSMPPWQQQQQTLPPLQIPPTSQSQTSQNQQQQQMHYMQKNLQIPPTSTSQQQQQQQQMQSQQHSSESASNINNNHISKHQQMMMNTNYNNEIKPTLSQNDFWFNDKINETPVKHPSPARPSKSLFSPSPEHPDEKSKYMMMTNIKPERAVDSPKEERKSTPSKREKSSLSGSSHSQKPQMPSHDKKFVKNEMNPPSTVDMAALSQDPVMPNKKRSYATVKDEGNSRAEKVRKLEGIKTESSSRMSQLFDTPPIPSKQPIETNPEIVKSLLKECFSSSNKFDQYDMNDSPLDVINPEPPEELLAVPSKVDTHMKKEPMDISLASNVIATTANVESDDKMDSSAGEGHGGKHKKKSKKKKDKHKHKKKHKHSDRESSPHMRLILSKNSSPESNSAFGSGGLKIKIPMKDVASAINPPHQTPQPAPLKLKISKEKFGSFTNLNNNNNNTSTPSASMSSTSSSSHKKKDKDREKSKSSKSSKHGSDYKESSSSSSYHHQQHSAQ